MLRNRLVAEGWAVAEVPPNLAREFVSGDPGLAHDEMQLKIEEVWGERCSCTDWAEAYCLAQAARCLRQPDLYTRWRVESLRRVVRGKPIVGSNGTATGSGAMPWMPASRS